MSYLPNTEDDVRRMLATIGIDSIEALYERIPEELRSKGALDLPEPLSEMDLVAHLEALSRKSRSSRCSDSFLGAGCYDHFIPAVVRALAGRSEFYTAYTPYQAEISQGTLQAIFEFQTLVCQLTGMEVANASMYDGASSLAEAVLMANRINGRPRAVLSMAVHPEYRQVVSTYVGGAGIELVEIPEDDTGRTDADQAARMVDGETAALVVQSPNFFGSVEDLRPLVQATQKHDALLIAVVNEPVSLGILQPPGAFGADIVVGEGQAFGIPMSFGGPHLGLFATRKSFVRKMPGRLVGETVDKEGRRGYVLTLSTREQHIRREKATSNICTNEGLCALMATICLAALGPRGLEELARLNLSRSEYAKRRISGLPGYSLRYTAPTFNEFVVEAPVEAERLVEELAEQGFHAGVPLGRFYPGMERSLLVCVTEQTGCDAIDRYVEALPAGGSK